MIINDFISLEKKKNHLDEAKTIDLGNGSSAYQYNGKYYIKNGNSKKEISSDQYSKLKKNKEISLDKSSSSKSSSEINIPEVPEGPRDMELVSKFRDFIKTDLKKYVINNPNIESARPSTGFGQIGSQRLKIKSKSGNEVTIVCPDTGFIRIEGSKSNPIDVFKDRDSIDKFLNSL